MSDLLSQIRDLNLQTLDESHYCEIVFDFPNFEFYGGYDLMSNFISFNGQTCEPSFVIQPLNLNLTKQECNQRSTFIKDPNVTFLFINDMNHNLDQYFGDFSTLPCVLPNQPYFFVMNIYENETQVNEVQVFSKLIKVVARDEKMDTFWIEEKNWPDTYERRLDFQRSKVIAHFTDWKENGQLMGYHGELGALIAEAFNLTLELIPLTTYGVKIGENEYTGTVNDLINNNIDFAMSHFDFIPERLEVTEGGFSTYLKAPELIFWQTQDYDFNFIMVLSFKSCLVLILLTLISSLAYFLILLRYKKISRTNHFEKLIEAVIVNLRALAILDINDMSSAKSIVQRIFLLTITLSGALFYWHFTGLLVSYFTFESEKPPITSFDDILNVPT